MDGSIVANIGEMLLDSLGNRYLHLRDAQCLHQRGGIIVGTVSRSETRHSNTDNALAVVTETVEGTHTNQQSQCRVEAATDADDNVLTIGMNESFGQS